MPLFGAHMSIAGGLHKALNSAQALGMGTVQLFTGSPQTWPVTPLSEGGTTFQSGKLFTRNASQWRARELGEQEVTLFRRTLRRCRLRFPMAHDSYLINLASPEEDLHRRSLEALVVEMQRAERLGLCYLIAHPGAHMGSGEEEGLARVARGIDEVHARCPGYRVKILLETTAGQGTTLGHRFEHLAGILARVAEPRRLGVCFDTCHVFAAGYALAPEKEYHATFRAFARTVGLRRLRAFHVNDSLRPFDSRRDRHAHIGQGHLGLEPFRLLVNDPRFRHHPMILETPKEEGDQVDMDAVNLTTLRGLLAPAPASERR
jgi:deoxyribonuclease-4